MWTEKLRLFVVLLFCSVDRCRFHFQFVSPSFSFNFKTSLAANFGFSSYFDQTQYFQTWPNFIHSNSIVIIAFVDYYFADPYRCLVWVGIVWWVAPGQKLRRWVSPLLLLFLLLLLLLLLLSVNTQQPEGQGICSDPEGDKSNQLNVGKIWIFWLETYFFFFWKSRLVDKKWTERHSKHLTCDCPT